MAESLPPITSAGGADTYPDDSLVTSENTLRRLRRLLRSFSEPEDGENNDSQSGTDVDNEDENNDDNLFILRNLVDLTMRTRRRLVGNDAYANRGSPPASKSVIEALVKENVEEGALVECAVCNDNVGVGELVTKLACGHGYHGDCIVPWLERRNTCPVCRFELETDDAEYEESKRRREASMNGTSS